VRIHSLFYPLEVIDAANVSRSRQSSQCFETFVLAPPFLLPLGETLQEGLAAFVVRGGSYRFARYDFVDFLASEIETIRDAYRGDYDRGKDDVEPHAVSLRLVRVKLISII
jgi:hypothetical protein